MAANHVHDHQEPAWPTEHIWSITTGTGIECASCEGDRLTGLTVEDHGGEIALCFRCQNGHTWSVRLALEDGRIVPHLADPRRRDGEKAVIPWSRSLTGAMRRISDWNEPGALHIQHVGSDGR